MTTTPDYTTNWGIPKPKSENFIAADTQNLRILLNHRADKVDQSLTQVGDRSSTARDDAAEALRKLWYKSRLATTDDLDDLRGAANAGMHPVPYQVSNTPTGAAGWVEVVYDSNSGRTRQNFFESSPNRNEHHTRVYSGGSWRDWRVIGWVSAPVTSGSVDDLRIPGLYPLGSAVADKPYSGIGTLEVWPVDTGQTTIRQVAYRASRSSPEVWQRYIAGSTTGNWIQDPSREEFDTLVARVDNMGDGGGGSSLVPRQPLEERPATITEAPAASRPEALSKDRTRTYTALATTLHYSDDDGETWDTIRTFSGTAVESTLVLDNGELLVTGNVSSRSRRVVWVSEGLHTNDEQWHEVLEAPHQYIKFTQAWSQATHGRIVLLAEYGPKAGMAWGGNDNIPEGEGAVQVHLSMDYGHTWQVIFNLADYVVDHHQRPNGDLQHLHGIEWDPYWDRIWVGPAARLGDRCCVRQRVLPECSSWSRILLASTDRAGSVGDDGGRFVQSR